jgi:hypothetical protein
MWTPQKIRKITIGLKFILQIWSALPNGAGMLQYFRLYYWLGEGEAKNLQRLPNRQDIAY